MTRGTHGWDRAELHVPRNDGRVQRQRARSGFVLGSIGRDPHPDQQRDDQRPSLRLRGLPSARRRVADSPVAPKCRLPAAEWGARTTTTTARRTRGKHTLRRQTGGVMFGITSIHTHTARSPTAVVCENAQLYGDNPRARRVRSPRGLAPRRRPRGDQRSVPRPRRRRRSGRLSARRRAREPAVGLRELPRRTGPAAGRNCYDVSALHIADGVPNLMRNAVAVLVHRHGRPADRRMGGVVADGTGQRNTQAAVRLSGDRDFAARRRRHRRSLSSGRSASSRYLPPARRIPAVGRWELAIDTGSPATCSQRYCCTDPSGSDTSPASVTRSPGIDPDIGPRRDGREFVACAGSATEGAGIGCDARQAVRRVCDVGLNFDVDVRPILEVVVSPYAPPEATLSLRSDDRVWLVLVRKRLFSAARVR